MISSIISRLVILVFGTLYPAYASYKAVRTKNVKEYVKWMMYWIVFALFTCAETFTDMFLSFWFPFYYEIKIILVLWLLSPATKGSSILYRKFVHPMLSRREQEIDEYIAKAKEQGYHTVLHLGTKGVNYATTVLMQTAIKNLNLSSISSHSNFPLAHPSRSDMSVASRSCFHTSSAPSEEGLMGGNTEEDGAKQCARSESETDNRTYSEEPAPSEISDEEDFTYVPSKHMPLEKHTAKSSPFTPECRPTTRNRKARKLRNTNVTQ